MVSEPDFRLVAFFGDVKHDSCALPLGLVVGKLGAAFQDEPNDSLAGNELDYLLLGLVEIPIPIGELAAEPVGVAFDLSLPPLADVVDGVKDLLGRLIDREPLGVVLAARGWVRSRQRFKPTIGSPEASVCRVVCLSAGKCPIPRLRESNECFALGTQRRYRSEESAVVPDLFPDFGHLLRG